MKKIYSYILMIVCTMMFAGCQKDFNGILTAELENYTDGNGKVYIDNEGYACWQVGDKVRINGNDYGLIIPTGTGAHSNCATINIGADGDGVQNFTAVYPAENVVVANQGSCTVNFLENYIYRNKGNKQMVQAPMMAYTENGGTLSFKNIGSMIAVTVDNIAVTSGKYPVYIEITSDKKLWGQATCNYNGGEPTIEVDENIGGNVVTLCIPKNALPKDYRKLKFYIPILPVTSATNLRIEVGYDCKDGNTQFIKKSSQIKDFTAQPLTIGRNNIVNGPTFTMDNSKDPRYFLADQITYNINSLKDFTAFKYECDGPDNNAFAGKTFVQGVDLNIPADLSCIENFYGIYKGGEGNVRHKIIVGSENEESTNGLFLNLTKFSNNPVGIYNLEVTAYVHCSPKRLVEKAGIIVAKASNAIIKNCIANGYLKLNEEPFKNPYIEGVSGSIGNLDQTWDSFFGYAGIVGICNGGMIENCVNNAVINSEKGFAQCYDLCGGIVGQALKTSSIKNCMNMGNVQGSDNVGGMVGGIGDPAGALWDETKGDVTIENSCVNGSFSETKEGATIGGMAGKIIAGTLTLNNVYVGGTVTNGKWIVGSGSISSSTNIYSPSAAVAENGCTATLYTNENGTLMVGTTSLLQTLNNNRIGHTDWKDWVDATQPKLNL